MMAAALSVLHHASWQKKKGVECLTGRPAASLLAPQNQTQTLFCSVTLLSGDQSKGDLDSKQIRDFNGDKMLMSLVVQDVVCHRYYEKIKED